MFDPVTISLILGGIGTTGTIVLSILKIIEVRSQKPDLVISILDGHFEEKSVEGRTNLELELQAHNRGKVSTTITRVIAKVPIGTYTFTPFEGEIFVEGKKTNTITATAHQSSPRFIATFSIGVDQPKFTEGQTLPQFRSMGLGGRKLPIKVVFSHTYNRIERKFDLYEKDSPDALLRKVLMTLAGYY